MHRIGDVATSGLDWTHNGVLVYPSDKKVYISTGGDGALCVMDTVSAGQVVKESP